VGDPRAGLGKNPVVAQFPSRDRDGCTSLEGEHDRIARAPAPICPLAHASFGGPPSDPSSLASDGVASDGPTVERGYPSGSSVPLRRVIGTLITTLVWARVGSNHRPRDYESRLARSRTFGIVRKPFAFNRSCPLAFGVSR
jgi:hypothetical protein